jgi:hypothetical protein
MHDISTTADQWKEAARFRSGVLCVLVTKTHSTSKPQYSYRIGRVTGEEHLAGFIGVYPISDGRSIDLENFHADNIRDLVAKAEAWILEDAKKHIKVC